MSFCVLGCFAFLIGSGSAVVQEDPPDVQGLQELISGLGASDAAVRDAAQLKLETLGVSRLAELQEAQAKAEKEYSSASRRYHLLKKLVTETGWPGIEQLKADVQGRYGRALSYFGPASERLGSRFDAAERFFPRLRFVAVGIQVEGSGGYEIYSVRQLVGAWKRIAKLLPYPNGDESDGAEAALVELTREEGVRFQDEAAVRDFITVSYLFLGAGPSLECGTGVEFRTRVERTSKGWTVYEEHRQASGNDTGPWMIRWTTTLTLNLEGTLTDLDRGPTQPDSDATQLPKP